MSHAMKLWERAIEQRLRHETPISNNQFCFMPGRYTMVLCRHLKFLT